MVTDEVWLHALYLGPGYFPNLFNGVFLGHRRFFGVPALSQPTRSTSSRGKRIPSIPWGINESSERRRWSIVFLGISWFRPPGTLKINVSSVSLVSGLTP